MSAGKEEEGEASRKKEEEEKEEAANVDQEKSAKDMDTNSTSKEPSSFSV